MSKNNDRYLKTEHGHKFDPDTNMICLNCGIIIAPSVKNNGWIYIEFDNKNANIYSSWYCENIVNEQMIKEIIE